MSKKNIKIYSIHDKDKFPKVHRYVCDSAFFNLFSNVKLEIGNILKVGNEYRKIKEFENFATPICERLDFEGLNRNTKFYGAIKTVPVERINSNMV